MLKHPIDTDDTSPGKQRVRRTATFSQGEEEGHTGKRFAAGGIQPISTSPC